MENNTLCNRHSLGVNNHTKMYVTYTRIYGWSDYGGESSYQPGYRLENMMWMTLLVYDYIIPGEKEEIDMNELSKVVNAQLQQAAENLVRNRLMSDEFLDFVQENTKPLDTLMAYYKCAIMEVETKFKVLNEQFSLEYDRNPIESIKTRVKSLDGIVRKVRRKNIPLTLSAIEQNINDIAGIRVVCSFPEDIYLLADCLLQQDDIRLIEQKDYIKHPKENGYRSLHLIVAVPIFLQNEKREMKVEVQLRTIAMDFWASLEHKVRYKKNVPADETERLAQELSECAQISADLDQRMQNIRTRLADAELQHPQKQKKDEQILLDVLGL